MMTVLDTLKSINAYPIPLNVISTITTRRSILMTSEATLGVLESDDYKLARADVMLWLSTAPNVSQGGISYSLTDEQRLDLKRQSSAIYEEYEEASLKAKSLYGYKGSKF